ncbi:unnamed protein product [Ectocarpus sp. 12 AP-2014]
MHAWAASLRVPVRSLATSTLLLHDRVELMHRQRRAKTLGPSRVCPSQGDRTSPRSCKRQSRPFRPYARKRYHSRTFTGAEFCREVILASNRDLAWYCGRYRILPGSNKPHREHLSPTSWKVGRQTRLVSHAFAELSSAYSVAWTPDSASPAPADARSRRHKTGRWWH